MFCQPAEIIGVEKLGIQLLGIDIDGEIVRGGGIAKGVEARQECVGVG